MAGGKKSGAGDAVGRRAKRAGVRKLRRRTLFAKSRRLTLFLLFKVSSSECYNDTTKGNTARCFFLYCRKPTTWLPAGLKDPGDILALQNQQGVQLLLATLFNCGEGLLQGKSKLCKALFHPFDTDLQPRFLTQLSSRVYITIL